MNSNDVHDVLALLACCNREQAEQIVPTLRARLPFLRTGFEDASALPVGEFPVFGGMHELYRSFINGIQEIGDESFSKILYTYFDGIRPDLRQLFPDMDFTDCLRLEERKAPPMHQLMVFVTGMCNLHCSYCFSNDIERTYISADNLKRIIAWAKKNQCSMITPCGGEPLMYRHFGLFLDLIAENGMTTYFASNGTFPLSAFSQQLPVIRQIAFHITESLWRDADYMRTFCDNILLAQQHHIDVMARANIISPDTDIEPWFQLVNDFGIKQLNIALTIPSGTHDNSYTDIKFFSSYVPVIKKCIERCREYSISLSFAKPIPPCVFDSETASWLLQYDNFSPTCNAYEDHGMRNICLSPNMQFTPCLGVPQPQIPFSDTLSWQELQQTMGTEIGKALREPLFSKCQDCFLYSRNLCQGACLSYKYL